MRRRGFATFWWLRYTIPLAIVTYLASALLFPAVRRQAVSPRAGEPVSLYADTFPLVGHEPRVAEAVFVTEGLKGPVVEVLSPARYRGRHNLVLNSGGEGIDRRGRNAYVLALPLAAPSTAVR